MYKVYTVGENIIATTKIRNNYGAIKFLFSIALVKLPLLILFASFFVSFLCFFFYGSLSLKLSLFLALKGDSEKITVTFR